MHSEKTRQKIKMTAASTFMGVALLVNSAAAIADDNPDTPQLHPLEKFCVVSEMAGMMTGEWTECARDYAYERYELQYTVINMGPISQTDDKRVLYVGDKIYTIPKNGTPTVADNPMYASTVAALDDSDPMTLATDMLGSMGFNPNGETMNIVGYTCNVATGQLGTICMTDDGLVLYMNTMGQTRTAKRVDLDSGGDDENYVPPVNPQQAPDINDLGDFGDLGDLGDLLQGLGNQNQQ